MGVLLGSGENTGHAFAHVAGNDGLGNGNIQDEEALGASGQPFLQDRHVRQGTHLILAAIFILGFLDPGARIQLLSTVALTAGIDIACRLAERRRSGNTRERETAGIGS